MFKNNILPLVIITDYLKVNRYGITLEKYGSCIKQNKLITMISSIVMNRLSRICSGNKIRVILSIFMLLISATAFSQDRTSFIIAKSEIHDSYMLCAIFDKNVTSKILESVNYYMIKNNRLFMKRTFQEKTLILADKTTFHVTIKPGELRINFRKTDNTLGRYDTLKSRCNNMEEKINEASGYEETISNIKELSIVDNPVP